ncbi:MAG: ATP-dependent protease LonB [archaeon]
MSKKDSAELSFKSTAEIEVSKKLIEQVIGQENSVEIIKKAAAQKRNVLLVGLPGTGKSMLAQAMAEILPLEKLSDILIYPNRADSNNPKVRVVKAGEGRKITEQATLNQMQKESGSRLLGFVLPLGWFILASVLFSFNFIGEITFAALLILGGFILVGFALGSQIRTKGESDVPKLLIDNSGKKIAPFIEATGARAGALLGDVRHDPLQTIFPNTVVYLVENERIKPVLIKALAEKLLNENIPLVNKSFKDYEALVIPENKILKVLGFVDGKPAPVNLLGVNKKTYSGKMVKVRTNENTVIVTPEHKIWADKKYVAAEKLSGNEKLAIYNEPVLTEQDVFNTFSDFDKHSAGDYQRYVSLKSVNPSFGYKRIAKLLNIPQGRVRWWHSINSKPNAVKTVELLKELDLIPLKCDDPRLPVISRILGTTFGDGGIAGNLNNIFLSSSEEISLKQFKHDLISVFGEYTCENFSEIISGRNKTGRCIRNSNRAIIRFFVALGAPVGKKNMEIEVPRWIHANEISSKEFFGAFFGNELCSPKFSVKHKYINDFAVALCGKKQLKENRLKFFSEISDFLASYGIKTTSVYENEFRKGSFMWKLGISKELENITRFKEFIKLRYSDEKQGKIDKALLDLFEWKKVRKAELEANEKSNQSINSILNISGQIMEQIALGKPFSDREINYSGTIYNITTSSGNIVANGILISNSGGLGTPAHLRVEPGYIHRTNGGVLFLDEIATLSQKSQQELLTAMQEKKYSITGQSELSSGAMTRTEAIPCDFVLVAAGNYQDLEKVHPALRSRIRGYGYELYMNLDMPDTIENRHKIVQFVAQEIKKDGKIPHFSKKAVEVIIFEAKRRAGRKNNLTLKLRDLGGLIRAAGDIAKEKGHSLVEEEDVLHAKINARTLEQQMVKQMLDDRKGYDVFLNEGTAIGRVNGLAVSGDGDAGMILPIEAEIAPAQSSSEGKIIATGKLGEIAKEAVQNVSAIIKRISGKDISKYDLHIQFLQTYSGVEGDSASVSVATAVISALEKIPIKQSLAMTGSLSVRGEVLPVGGVTAKVAAAIAAGFKQVIVPKANIPDIILTEAEKQKIEIIPASTLSDVLKNAFEKEHRRNVFLKQLEKILNIELPKVLKNVSGKQNLK